MLREIDKTYMYYGVGLKVRFIIEIGRKIERKIGWQIYI